MRLEKMRKNEEFDEKQKRSVKMKFCLPILKIYTMQTATAVVTSDQQGETKSTVSLAKLASIDAQLQSFLDATLDSTSLQSSSINVDLLRSIRGIQIQLFSTTTCEILHEFTIFQWYAYCTKT